MTGLLADWNVRGQFLGILQILESDDWRELWQSVDPAVHTFESLGLRQDALDMDIWTCCQQHEIVFFTANRNRDGSGSLEDVIRRLNTPESLPVITLANSKRVLKDRIYADQVAERLLDYLMNLNECRGAGRLFVP